MIDINNTLDLIKLKFYNEWLYTAHIYDEVIVWCRDKWDNIRYSHVVINENWY